VCFLGCSDVEEDPVDDEEENENEGKEHEMDET
jgi:hypothetical protein